MTTLSVSPPRFFLETIPPGTRRDPIPSPSRHPSLLHTRSQCVSRLLAIILFRAPRDCHLPIPITSPGLEPRALRLDVVAVKAGGPIPPPPVVYHWRGVLVRRVSTAALLDFQPSNTRGQLLWMCRRMTRSIDFTPPGFPLVALHARKRTSKAILFSPCSFVCSCRPWPTVTAIQIQIPFRRGPRAVPTAPPMFFSWRGLTAFSAWPWWLPAFSSWACRLSPCGAGI